MTSWLHSVFWQKKSESWWSSPWRYTSRNCNSRLASFNACKQRKDNWKKKKKKKRCWNWSWENKNVLFFIQQRDIAQTQFWDKWENIPIYFCRVIFFYVTGRFLLHLFIIFLRRFLCIIQPPQSDIKRANILWVLTSFLLPCISALSFIITGHTGLLIYEECDGILRVYTN